MMKNVMFNFWISLKVSVRIFYLARSTKFSLQYFWASFQVRFKFTFTKLGLSFVPGSGEVRSKARVDLWMLFFWLWGMQKSQWNGAAGSKHKEWVDMPAQEILQQDFSGFFFITFFLHSQLLYFKKTHHCSTQTVFG